MTERAASRGRPSVRRAGPPLAAVLGRGDLGTSLLLVFPLFLVYEVGVLYAPAMNGVDFVTRALFAALDYDRGTFLLLHVGLAVLFVAVLWLLRRRRVFDLGRVAPMFLESAIYAVTLGSLIIFVMHRLLGIDPSLAVGGLPDVVVAFLLSCGAGVHEELVFRLGLLSGGAAVARLLGIAHVPAVIGAALISSVLFSAAHHLGALGDPWSVSVFVYRLLAGLIFAAIYYYRSLAHAVYTHALYDIYVLVLR